MLKAPLNDHPSGYVLAHFLSLHLIQGALLENSDPPVAQADSPVPQEVLCEIVRLQKSSLSFDDIISKLKSKTVPSGYPVHTWRDGMLGL